MFKTTLKGIKEFNAIDVSNWNDKDLQQLIKNGIEKVAYSAGIYGINGIVFQDDVTKEFYKITSRNGNLFLVA